MAEIGPIVVCARGTFTIVIDPHSVRLGMLTAFDSNQSILRHQRSVPSQLRRVRRVHGVESMMYRTVNALNVGNAKEMSTLLNDIVQGWDQGGILQMSTHLARISNIPYHASREY